MNTTSQKNDIDLRDVSFEYPVTLEPEVIDQIRLLQGPMNPSLAVWLSRRGRYEALISAELRRAQMPKELLAVAIVESGFFTRRVLSCGCCRSVAIHAFHGNINGRKNR